MSEILRVIKKYPNRRLYDTETNAYITLDDVKQLVINRVNFQVIDAKTGSDITQSTLLQIINEQESGTNPLFTTEMLQHFIRFYNEQSQDAFRTHLEQMTQLFTKQRDLFTEQWQSYMDIMAGKRPDNKDQ